MSLNQMSLAELPQRLLTHGEEAPRAWAKSQLKLRLIEIEGEAAMQPQTKEASPLRQMEVNINKAARRKADLQKFVKEELGVDLTGTETVEILKMKALNWAYNSIPGHAEDPVGFGQWCHLKYQEVKTQQPAYCQWVLTTAAEGQCSPRLRRLADWLKTVEKTTRPRPCTSKTPSHPMGPSSSTTPTPGQGEEVKAMLQNLMVTVKNLSDDMVQVKQNAKEAKRRGRHFYERLGSSVGAAVGEPPKAYELSEGELMDAPECQSRELSLSEIRTLSWKAERLLPESMEALVQARKPILLHRTLF